MGRSALVGQRFACAEFAVFAAEQRDRDASSHRHEHVGAGEQEWGGGDDGSGGGRVSNMHTGEILSMSPRPSTNQSATISRAETTSREIQYTNRTMAL